jgi:predicted RNA-binding Zn ribbon-like protein
MALALRESIHASVRAVVLQEKLDTADITRMNEIAALPIAAPRLAGGSSSLSWHAEMPVLAALASIARDAVTLVGTADRTRMKICRHRDCRMLFLDASPRNSRRWCAMSICGNREKVAAHRRRLRNKSSKTTGGSI